MNLTSPGGYTQEVFVVKLFCMMTQQVCRRRSLIYFEPRMCRNWSWQCGFGQSLRMTLSILWISTRGLMFVVFELTHLSDRPTNDGILVPTNKRSWDLFDTFQVSFSVHWWHRDACFELHEPAQNVPLSMSMKLRVPDCEQNIYGISLKACVAIMDLVQLAMNSDVFPQFLWVCE